jgi:hypothetical protein
MPCRTAENAKTTTRILLPHLPVFVLWMGFTVLVFCFSGVFRVLKGRGVTFFKVNFSFLIVCGVSFLLSCSDTDTDTLESIIHGFVFCGVVWCGVWVLVRSLTVYVVVVAVGVGVCVKLLMRQA